MKRDSNQLGLQTSFPIAPSAKETPREIKIGLGRALKATPVFDTYWRFAAKRQNLFMNRVNGAAAPWTDDPILLVHKFTNAYRASDRVSQYLIRNVIYNGEQSPEEIFFRTMLFKFFNRIDTWESLVEEFGSPSWKDFSLSKYSKVLGREMENGPIYSAAYIMPSPAFGDQKKFKNHLLLLQHMMKTRAPSRISEAASLQEVFEILLSYPSLGKFLAFQFAIDLNYSSMINFSEMDFVVAGPGACDGIRKCFSDMAGLNEAEVIRVVTEIADSEFARLGLTFQSLWGRKLQLIDCQNIFCEVDKYSRVFHPEYSGVSGRTRIKQKFSANTKPLPQWYPPKWNLQMPKPKTKSGRSPSTDRPAIIDL